MSATCSIQPFEGKHYEKPDNVMASMYVAMVAVPAVKQLLVMALSVKAHWLPLLMQSQIVKKSLPIHYFAVVPL